jgi:hypothetical protein
MRDERVRGFAFLADRRVTVDGLYLPQDVMMTGGSRDASERRHLMDILVELIKAVATLGVMALIALLMAALFIIVLSLATGIDRNIQPEEERS